MPYRDKEQAKAHRREWEKKNYPRRKEWNRQQLERGRALVAEVKSTARCARCGEDDPACLDFHHRDPGAKEISVSNIGRKGWSPERILREIEKCDILCSNCHRKLHRDERLAAADDEG